MARAWLLAARPATWLVSLSPVVLGSAIAYSDGVFHGGYFVITMSAALSIQVGANFANDAADAASGADDSSRIGPPRAVASGLISAERMWRGVVAAFGLATLAGGILVTIAGPVIAVVGIASIVAAFGYTGGSRPYGYRGLGELFVFIFFGLVATAGTRFVFDRTAPLAAWLAGVVMGLLATAVLLANNVRDVETDRAAGKNTLVAKLGREAGIAIYSASVAGAFAVLLLTVLSGWLPGATLVALLAVPLAVPLVRVLRRESTGPPLIAVLKGTARLQLIVAAAISFGLVVTAPTS